ncbi:PocR ligand-binding domain-containing protein [Candidatus Latescibacterota bacterium]
MDKEKPKIFEYITAKQLQIIQNSFSDVFGIACSVFNIVTKKNGEIIDSEFKRITRETGCSKFCKLVRSTTKGVKLCDNCDRINANKLCIEVNKKLYEKSIDSLAPLYINYTCHAGLIDITTPIIVGRGVVAMIFAGQRRIKAKVTGNRIEEIINLAKKINISPDKLIQYYLELSEISPQIADKAAKHIAQTANQISILALQAKRFQLVSKGAKAVTTELDPEKVYDQILDCALDVSDCERATLWEYKEKEEKLFVLQRKAPPGIKEGVLPKERDIGVGLAGRVAIIKRTAFIKDIDKEKEKENIKIFLGGLKSEIAVPIFNNKLLGVLTVKSWKAGPWPCAVKQSLEALAGIAAMAIINSRTVRRQRDIIGYTAHQFSSPLHGVGMYLEKIIKMRDSLSPQQLEDYGEKCLLKVNDAESNVQDLMLILESSSLEIELEESITDIESLINDTLKLLDDEAEDKGINITKSITHKNTKMLIDKRRMTHIALRNIIHNAIKFSAKDATVKLTTNKSTKGYTITVANKTDFLPVKDINKLTEAYVRIGKERGYGLGLTAAEFVVSLHGGELKIIAQDKETFVAKVLIPLERVVNE